MRESTSAYKTRCSKLIFTISSATCPIRIGAIHFTKYTNISSFLWQLCVPLQYAPMHRVLERIRKGLKYEKLIGHKSNFSPFMVLQSSQAQVPLLTLQRALSLVLPLLAFILSVSHCVAFEFQETVGKFKFFDYVTTMPP